MSGELMETLVKHNKPNFITKFRNQCVTHTKPTTEYLCITLECRQIMCARPACKIAIKKIAAAAMRAPDIGNKNIHNQHQQKLYMDDMTGVYGCRTHYKH